MKNKLSAATKSIASRAQSGISASDKAALDSAVSFAETVDVPRQWIEPFLREAKAEQEKAARMLEVKQNLSVALASGDRVTLRDALNAAENLDMEEDVVAKAKSVLKDAEIAHRETLAKDDSMPANVDFDEAEKARELRYEIARQTRFDIKNFPGLRTPEEFARGSSPSCSLLSYLFPPELLCN